MSVQPIYQIEQLNAQEIQLSIPHQLHLMYRMRFEEATACQKYLRVLERFTQEMDIAGGTKKDQARLLDEFIQHNPFGYAYEFDYTEDVSEQL